MRHPLPLPLEWPLEVSAFHLGLQPPFVVLYTSTANFDELSGDVYLLGFQA